MISIGLDVSKLKLDLGWLRDSQSGKVKTKVFNNSDKDFKKMSDWIIKNTKADPADILITLEATGVYHEPICYFLHKLGFPIYVANPAHAKSYADGMGITHKTDKSDSIMLAKFAVDRREKVRIWQPDPIEVRELKSMITRLNALESDYQREENRLGSSEFSLPSERVLESLNLMIKIIKEEIERLKSDINDHIDQHPKLKETHRNLMTIPGVGPVLARMMTLLLVSKDFKNAKQVAAFLGLIPKIKESGLMKGRSTLSKTGSPLYRAKLYMAAICASQWNPDIKRQKEILLANGKSKMQALGAAMRKLVQICYGVYKSQKEYQPQVN
ncbi:MAG: IS110 family transposase [Saccharospirillaceae bacterium]|nr:IS110 family transposase [Pseudomonadales bacterium]NRB80819.1 IS110 family transposase [Saccharospirillaceae bacterium]